MHAFYVSGAASTCGWVSAGLYGPDPGWMLAPPAGGGCLQGVVLVLSVHRLPSFHRGQRSTTRATLKNTKRLVVSTIVVISGPAMMAGSKQSFLARIGRSPPVSFAATTVIISVIPTLPHRASGLPFMKYVFTRLVVPRMPPTASATRSSLYSTRSQSCS